MTEQKPPEKPQVMETTSTKNPPNRRKDASLGREVQAKIGQQLRAYYDGLIEPTPDRFVDLLRQLDKPGDKGTSE
jgi:Anti-sigma factor NepR